jgi:hypothetical protein
MAKEKMADLYIPGRMLCRSAYNLLLIYDIMNRIYRSTINPKHTNHDEVHGFHQVIQNCRHLALLQT